MRWKSTKTDMDDIERMYGDDSAKSTEDEPIYFEYIGIGDYTAGGLEFLFNNQVAREAEHVG
ncbi:hypothetical protein [uncultured Paraglaciecola sp.]|uniref:hypothetical protein n=1 Tax=uncultured Paraglaciecola sp. TaxID=1765024 RepID=UPI002625B65A|nr:hypothetical protein [uncultured Paraglaciecola sp.]